MMHRKGKYFCYKCDKCDKWVAKHAVILHHPQDPRCPMCKKLLFEAVAELERKHK